MKQLPEWSIGGLLLILVFACCSEEPPSIIGHWHVYWHYDGDPTATYTPVNFENDSLGMSLYLNQPFGHFFVAREQDSLTFNYGHGPANYEMIWHHPDTIKLLNTNYGRTTLLIRKQPTSSDLYSDYFSESLYRYEIQLASRKCTSSRVRPIFEHPVRIGKNILPHVYDQDYVYVLGDKIVPKLDTIDLNLYAEQHRVKLREQMRDSIVPMLYVDKNAPDSMVDQLTDYYKRSGFQQVAYMYVDSITQPDTVLFCPTIVRLD